MKITRKFTKDGADPFASVKWIKRSSRISNPDGSTVFEMKDAEVPETWSQLATDIMVSKYFRKAGVPDGKGATGPEKSARQVIHRLAGCWRHWGEKHNYFDSKADAQAFYDELAHMLVNQVCAPNSPQWFNTGLNFAYSISGPAQGHWIVNPQDSKVRPGTAELADDAYTHPQPHACFIQSITDDLVNEGGIMDLWVREARLFKYGSGTGTNFSNLRAEGEPLSGGGKSSGLMSWLRIGDRAASAIKSGGTTRRAAKMVCLDMSHPDIETFINWKVREEIKVQALVEGLKLLKKHDQQLADTAAKMKLDLDYDFNGEAYLTVSGQNSNNSVRIPDEFFETLDTGGQWKTHWRTTPEKPARTFDSTKLWDEICYAAWRCADPGVQFDSTINAWHTCPSGGRINASNPCSEYMFLDNTACNLASLNVLKFYDPARRIFDIERYEHAIDLWTIVLEISVLMAAFPSREIAELSYKYRTLGLGYANLGAMLMQAGIPYDSDEARAVCATLTAILTGRSYRQSALIAKELQPFPGYAADKDNMLRVIRNHRRAAQGLSRDASDWEGLNTHTRPVPIDHSLIKAGKVNIANADDLLIRSVAAWDDALELGKKHGFRNAQVTVIAPTGTIGLLMDCDTTGVEPDFALVKFKKLAGGGYFKIANESVAPALKALGYGDEQANGIMTHLLGNLTLNVPMPGTAKGVTPGTTLAAWLSDRGLSDHDLVGIEKSLPSVFEISFAFTAWSISEETLKHLGFDPSAARQEAGFNLLRKLGLKTAEIDQLNTLVCGTQTVEGAPQLAVDHLPVFDCASKCGKLGKRFIAPSGHIRMMAAAQPFISGAISKTINLPNEATVSDIAESYRLSWELGLKANALYRDNCKLSQPLSASSDSVQADDDEADESELAAAREEVAESVASLANAAGNMDAPKVAEKTIEVVYRPMRRRLPDTRRSITHKFNVVGHEGYVTVGLYEDGKPGELFIQMSKEGSTIGGLMDALGTATSVALQYGVPIESLVAKFSHQRFEPAGMTENRDIPFAKSLVDYIFRWIGMEFIQGYRELHAPKRGGDQQSHADQQTAPFAGLINQTSVDRLGQGAAQDDPRRNKATSASLPPRIDARAGGGGNGGGGVKEVIAISETQIETQTQTKTTVVAAVSADTLTKAMESVGDAPPCDTCGTITVRSGTCYKCLNCGASLGCS
ncbi:MAG: adenosylcobalamin-dependent ribonucleoside-diphosphate reductase [Phycisphaerales bacterium]|nr:adenosylcobalamin-dependent ribonucleoside-diphosphate reductase [Phycisphaerales bacterium]